MTKLPSKSQTVNAFLAKAGGIKPPADRTTHRLIFAMDATASRASTWDIACTLHSELFSAVRENSNLAVQLAYFRGIEEFSTSNWSMTPDALLQKMLGVRCLGGMTQMLHLLNHVRHESSIQPVRALLFIGDCFEESESDALSAAGELAVYGVPIFLFQEGHDSRATRVFSQLARITRGAHIPFSEGSADELRELLRAAATFATHGRTGLQKSLSNPSAHKLLVQLNQ
jgi:hypothetical protein